MITGVPSVHLKFYDQTGVTFSKLYPDTRSVFPWLPRPHPTLVPSITSKHYSYFAVTNLHPDKPSRYYKMYEKTKEHSQDGDEHCDFLISAARAGFFERGDIIVADNWAPHFGARGKRLEEYLLNYHGVVLATLPPRWSYLNSVEHCWE